MAIKGKAREKKRARKKLEIDSQKKIQILVYAQKKKRCILLSKLQDLVPLGANHLTYEGPGVGRF